MKILKIAAFIFIVSCQNMELTRKVMEVSSEQKFYADPSKVTGISKIVFWPRSHRPFQGEFYHDLFNRRVFSCELYSERLERNQLNEMYEQNLLTYEELGLEDFSAFQRKYALKVPEGMVFFSEEDKADQNHLRIRAVNLTGYLNLPLEYLVVLSPGWYPVWKQVRKVYISRDSQFLYFTEDANRFTVYEIRKDKAVSRIVLYEISQLQYNSLSPIDQDYRKDIRLVRGALDTAKLTELPIKEQLSGIRILAFKNMHYIFDMSDKLKIKENETVYIEQRYLSEPSSADYCEVEAVPLRYGYYPLLAVTVPVDFVLLPLWLYFGLSR